MARVRDEACRRHGPVSAHHDTEHDSLFIDLLCISFARPSTAPFLSFQSDDHDDGRGQGAQRQSFAYGNTNFENDRITRKTIGRR